MLLTFIAVPHILFVEHFLLPKFFETISQLNICFPTLGTVFTVLRLFILDSSGGKVKQVFIDVLMEHNGHHYFLASLHSIVGEVAII